MGSWSGLDFCCFICCCLLRCKCESGPGQGGERREVLRAMPSVPLPQVCGVKTEKWKYPCLHAAPLHAVCCCTYTCEMYTIPLVHHAQVNPGSWPTWHCHAKALSWQLLVVVATEDVLLTRSPAPYAMWDHALIISIADVRHVMECLYNTVLVLRVCATVGVRACVCVCLCVCVL
mmetsp:Transcript_6753/g.14922  ORF Transcript_6753/g.14922 Transcript_6753/m.14922 type:complete len:175 (+) Transcript_6753:2216-2740(+)